MSTDDAFDFARRLPVAIDYAPALSRIRFAGHERRYGVYQPNLRSLADPPPSVLSKPPDPLQSLSEIHRIDAARSRSS